MKTSLLVLAAVSGLLPACTTLTPLKSTPPYGKIVVNRPFSRGNAMYRMNLPAGIYTPLFEDDHGYFYQAPQKLTGNDAWIPLMVDGGLYFARERPRPQKIYYIRGQSGSPIKLSISEEPDLTLQR